MATSEPTTIRYQLNEDDLKAVRQLLIGLKRPPNFFAVVLLYVVITPALPFMFLIAKGRFLERDVLLGYISLAALALFLVLRVFRAFRRDFSEWAQQPEARRFLQPTTLTIDGQGAHVASPLIKTSMVWSVFTGIEVAKSGRWILFWLGKDQAIVIPDRAFEDRHAFDSFVEEAHNLHRNFLGGAMVCRQCGYDMRGAPDAGCPECGWQRESYVAHQVITD